MFDWARWLGKTWRRSEVGLALLVPGLVGWLVNGYEKREGIEYKKRAGGSARWAGGPLVDGGWGWCWRKVATKVKAMVNVKDERRGERKNRNTKKRKKRERKVNPKKRDDEVPSFYLWAKKGKGC